jgi:pimeloyl-ACP methyl ester carboxylesterase
MADPADITGEGGRREQRRAPWGACAWRRLGSGLPLVLINGYAATADDWDPTFVAELARSATVICPDNRGTGGSDLGDEPLSVETMAGDVVGLLDHLGIDRAAICGWSMGGFVAQAVATASPERVERLILLATDPGGPGALRCGGEIWARLTDRSGTPREQATRLIGLLFPPPVAESVDREFGDIVAAARAALANETLEAQETAMRSWWAKSRPAPAPAPVLAAAGALDEVIPPANADALAGRDGDWLARFPGAGHGFMAQQPRRLAELMRAFLVPAG